MYIYLSIYLLTEFDFLSSR